MKSSYLNKNLNYGDILKTICYIKKPKKILEFGILEAYSLRTFLENTNNCFIEAYDLFEEFNGNGSKKEIINEFKDYDNVSIEYGDFYKKLNSLEDNYYDIIHIDIANDGDVYKFAYDNYRKRLKPGGIMILEGGSHERDQVEWMKTYNKTPIKDFLNNIEHTTIGTIPSITLIN